MGEARGDHAVIIGGGIAGLLAAHAVAPHFDRVTILERFSHTGEVDCPGRAARRGVPQSRCIHVLMAAGAAAFDALVPDWAEALIAHGAGPFDACADAVVQLPHGRLPRTPSGIAAYSCSRALFEKSLRRRLAPTVQLRESQKVVGLVSSHDNGSIGGVRTVNRLGEEATLAAELVVDATGAGSILAGWIAGLPDRRKLQVRRSKVDSGKQYVSRWFALDPWDAPDWNCFSVAPGAAAAYRSAMMARAEENRWGVILVAPAGQRLPEDDAGFVAFIASLGDAGLEQVLARAHPISSILRYGSTANRMMHLEAVADWPQGLVALGDSVCTLDPYFGLGMTLAARGAALLRRCLEQEGVAFSAIGFQRQLAELNAEPWQRATGRVADRAASRDANSRLGHLYESAPANPAAAHALIALQHLLRPGEIQGEVAG